MAEPECCRFIDELKTAPVAPPLARTNKKARSKRRGLFLNPTPD
jgi:hypothetical protein